MTPEKVKPAEQPVTLADLPEEEGSFDLRRYVDVLVRRWRLVFTVLVAGALAGLIISLLAPPGYEANAGIAIVKTKTDLVLDPRFKTLSNEELAAAGATQALNADARRSALVALVRNGEVAQRVLVQMQDRLKPDDRTPAALLRKISAEIVNRGDLIDIKASDEDPATAAALANTWAREYERYINAVYSGAPTDYSNSVTAEVERTRQEYDAAQAALEAFIGSNRIDDLHRQIDEKQSVLAAIQKGKSQVDAEVNSKLAVFNKPIAERNKMLADAYDTRVRLNQLVEDARAMRAQLEQGGDAAAASNALALQMLKAQAFALSAPMPANLQLQVGTPPVVTAEQQVADLDGLIAALEARIAKLGAQIDQLSADALNGRALGSLGEVADVGQSALAAYAAANARFKYTVDTLQEDIRAMQAELERANAVMRQLTETRELAWETYATLARKQTEVSVAGAIQGSEVRFASPAVVPDRRVRSRWLPALLGTGGGLALGVLLAYTAEFFGLQTPVAAPAPARRRPWSRAYAWVMRQSPGLQRG